MAHRQVGELFNAYTQGRTPAMSHDTKREIQLGCSALSARAPSSASPSRAAALPGIAPRAAGVVTDMATNAWVIEHRHLEYLRAAAQASARKASPKERTRRKKYARERWKKHVEVTKRSSSKPKIK
jgi:hypothetical protein